MPFSSKSWEAPLSGKRLLTLWNALHGVEKRSKVGERSGVRWTRRWRRPDSNHRSRVTRPSFSTPAHVTCLTPCTRKSRREREPILCGCRPAPAEPMVRILFPPARVNKLSDPRAPRQIVLTTSVMCSPAASRKPRACPHASGTDSSNPACSSEESANHRFLSGGAHHCGRLKCRRVVSAQ